MSPFQNPCAMLTKGLVRGLELKTNRDTLWDPVSAATHTRAGPANKIHTTAAPLVGCLVDD